MALVDFGYKQWLLIQMVPTVMMTGIIWMVQIVQYPLFKSLEGSTLTGFHAEYSMRITWVVLPLMVVEILMATIFTYRHPSRESLLLLGIVGAIWACTFFLSVPLHSKVAIGDMAIREKLVMTNWPRTILWSVRTIVLTFLVIKAK